MKKHIFLNDYLDKRMASGEAFTYGGLTAAIAPADERLADKRIQQWRRKGWIVFERKGSLTLWTLTPAGIEATAELR